ncbi:6757_t:CDS:2, partial [Funneliformis geosporum]
MDIDNQSELAVKDMDIDIDTGIDQVEKPPKSSTSGVDNNDYASSSSSTVTKRKQSPKNSKVKGTKNTKDKVIKKSEAVKKTTLIYKYKDGEVEESESFELIGEDPVINQGSSDGFEADKTSLPCRTLDEFTIYDVNCKNRAVSIEELDEEGRELHVSGIYFRTSTIFYFQIEYLQDGQSEIWIRTQYAFYKLLKASEAYVPYFMPVFKKIRTANIIIEAIASNPEITYEQFLDLLKTTSSFLSNSTTVEISEKDILKNIEYIYQELETWIDEKEAYGALSCPLLTSLLKILNKKSKRSKYVHSGDTDTVKTKRNVSIKSSKNNPNLSVLRHQNPTCVTPFIHNLTKGMFANKFITVKHDNESEDAKEPLFKIEAPVITKPVTHKVIWNEKRTAKIDDISYYNSAMVDGETIDVGDVVYVRNDDSDEPWFAKVMYMFEDSSKKKMFHSRFFNHGKSTFLEEFAGDREIFLLDNCTDNDLETVMGKAKVKRLDIDEDESFDFEDEHFYFYRFWYDEKYAAFEEARLHEDPMIVFNYCTEYEQCHSCENLMAAEQKQNPKWIYGDSQDTSLGLTYKGVDYHLNDFVYLIPEEANDNTPYEVGQIVELLNTGKRTVDDYFEKKNNGKQKVEEPAVCVRLLGRYDDLIVPNPSSKTLDTATYRDIILDSREVKDCRRLFFKSETRVIKKIKDKVEGLCWVEHKDRISDLNSYKDEMDTFYIDYKTTKKYPKLSDLESIDADEVQLCPLCKEKRQNRQKEMSEFIEYVNVQHKKLRAMDIFSGCGGLTVGMDKTGIVETMWAIEFASSAALTFEKNNPHAITYNQCANLLLERAIAEHSRKESLEPLQDFLDRQVPSMPAPGE